MIVSIKLCRDVVNDVCVSVCNIFGHIVSGFKATRGRGGGGGGGGGGGMKPPPHTHPGPRKQKKRPVCIRLSIYQEIQVKE